MKKWLFLVGAIACEVFGTCSLKASDGFSRLLPSTLVVIGYAGAFYLLSLTLKEIPVGIAYAIWSGVGVLLISLASWVLFGQKLDAPAVIGMLLIVVGVMVISLLSRSVGH